MWANTCRPSGEWLMPAATIRSGRTPRSSRSSFHRIEPAALLTSPLIARSSVVLPAPLDPISATTSPRSMSTDASCRPTIAP